jgi:hypothetical protein
MMKGLGNEGSNNKVVGREIPTSSIFISTPILCVHLCVLAVPFYVWKALFSSSMCVWVRKGKFHYAVKRRKKFFFGIVKTL